MKIILDNEDVLKILLTCFSDGGLEMLRYSGFTLEWDNNDYEVAKKALENPCVEDVWVQMLREKRRLYVVDHQNGGAKTDLTLEKALENLSKPETAADVVLLLGEGDYDAVPCDRLLQHALFGDVVYG